MAHFSIGVRLTLIEGNFLFQTAQAAPQRGQVRVMPKQHPLVQVIRERLHKMRQHIRNHTAVIIGLDQHVDRERADQPDRSVGKP